MARNPVRAVQDGERRRPCGYEASAHDLRARSRQPAALPQMRRGGPTPAGDPATTYTATAPPSNRTLTICNLSYAARGNMPAIDPEWSRAAVVAASKPAQSGGRRT